MITQTIDQHPYDQTVRWIKAKTSTILTNSGLLPRFKRWRLIQDPETGMILLFGILNNSFIATHTSIPFTEYFDPKVLHALANEMQYQVVSCDSDDLRYAFILDQGSVGRPPQYIGYPFLENNMPSIHPAYDYLRPGRFNDQQNIPVLLANYHGEEDQVMSRRCFDGFMGMPDDIGPEDRTVFERKWNISNPNRSVGGI